MILSFVYKPRFNCSQYFSQTKQISLSPIFIPCFNLKSIFSRKHGELIFCNTSGRTIHHKTITLIFVTDNNIPSIHADITKCSSHSSLIHLHVLASFCLHKSVSLSKFLFSFTEKKCISHKTNRTIFMTLVKCNVA